MGGGQQDSKSKIDLFASLFPKEMEISGILQKPIVIISIVLLIIPLIVAFPPFLDWYIDFWDLRDSMKNSPETWKNWLFWWSLSLEIFLALVLGGAGFGEFTASWWRSSLLKAQNYLDTLSDDELKRISDNIIKDVNQCSVILKKLNIFNFSWNIFELTHKIANISASIRDIPRVSTIFLTVKLCIGFPGGLLGVIAYISFYLLIALKILQHFVDQVI